MSGFYIHGDFVAGIVVAVVVQFTWFCRQGGSSDTSNRLNMYLVQANLTRK